MKRTGPPKLAERILSILSTSRKIGILGDTEEEYRMILSEKGRFRADMWYVWQILKPMPFFIRSTLYWRFIMFENYIKIALRNIKRHKGHSLINIMGLAVGMTCFIYIMLYVQHETSYDTFHKDADQIYRITSKIKGSQQDELWHYASTPNPLALYVKNSFPEIREATHFRLRDQVLLTYEEKHFLGKGMFTDKNFFNVFSFKLSKGNKKQVLNNPESIVITQNLAKKLFGDQNPIGKILNCRCGSLDERELGDLIITGILEDVPGNSHIQFDCLFPFVKQFPAERRTRDINDWINCPCYTYCLLEMECNHKELEQKISSATDEGVYSRYSGYSYTWEFLFQPLKDIHLKSHLSNEFSLNNDMKYILLVSALDGFILMLACVNAVNLSTAHAFKRMKEIGIRKVVGARRFQLFRQFTTESLFLTTIALVGSIILVYFLLPHSYHFIQRRIDTDMLISLPFILKLFFVLIVTGLLSSFYPALFLSAFQPVKILKGKMNGSGRGLHLRNGLILFQFSITIVLIIASAAIYHQIQFMKNWNTGFHREQIVVMIKEDQGIIKDFKVWKHEILKHPDILGVSATSALPTNISNHGVRRTSNNDGGELGEFYTHFVLVDQDFVDVFDIEIIQGRNFSEAYGTDEDNAVIVNETFVKQAGWKDAISQRVIGWSGGMVVGVARDFNFQSLHSEISPLFISYRPSHTDISKISIRIRSDNIPSTLSYIKTIYEHYSMKYPFEYSFLDDQFNQMYKKEKTMGTLIVLSSGLSIFVACLGIFGIASYTAERRIKEIGIRKVLGASVPGIIMQLSRGFAKWVVLANIIAWPIAYYSINKWLQNFAYRTNPSVWIFILSGLTALTIALLTVTYKTIKAARANPADSLRYE
ncbi:MAG: ABC transporter permease [Candidatus Aminicenantes bacterium]|nr:MAG: ABC transporter permease [Candidatus Aminicenantes bacterium]